MHRVSEPRFGKGGRADPTRCLSVGCAPTERRDLFAGLYEMDALQHVKDGTGYPSVLRSVGMTAPRVEAWHGGTMAARLQKATASDAPVLLRVNFDAGHGLGTTLARIDAERADQFAFVLRRALRASVA